MTAASISKPIVKFKHFWRMFGPIALHYGLKLHVLGPLLSRLEYIGGHPGYLSPRVEPMNADIETKDYFVCEIMSDDFNFMELSGATGCFNRDKYVSRLAGGQVTNVFSSISNFPPIEG